MSSSRTGRSSTEGGVFPADVVIADERIAALTLDASDWSAAERIDATGLLVMPGGIDTHTHFEEPDPRLLEGFTTGGAAAAAGGITVRRRDASGPPDDDHRRSCCGRSSASSSRTPSSTWRSGAG